MRRVSVEAPVLWEKVAKYLQLKAERKWKAKEWVIMFGGDEDDDSVV